MCAFLVIDCAAENLAQMYITKIESVESATWCLITCDLQQYGWTKNGVECCETAFDRNNCFEYLINSVLLKLDLKKTLLIRRKWRSQVAI